MIFDLDDSVELMAEETFALSKIQQVQIDFARYKDKVADMQKAALILSIVDADTNKTAVEMAGQSVAIHKAIEDKRKEIVKSPNDFVKAVNTFAKEYTTALETIKATIGQKITRYAQEQERKRLEAQRKANDEAKKLQDEINQAAEAAQEQPQVVVLPIVQEAPKVTRTSSGSATQTTTWTFEVTDFALLPDQFKMADSVSLNKAVKAGLRQIPGVNIYQIQGTRIRSSSLPFDNLEQF